MTRILAQVPLGIAWLLLGCSIVAAQFVLEEKVMAGGDATPPLIVVGMEGLWGTLIMLCIIFPLAKRAPGADLGGCYEDGTGVEKDVREAVRLYRLAADQGNAGAQNNLTGLATTTALQRRANI